MQPFGHLCGGLYTRDVKQLAAHVSHFAGATLHGKGVQPGACLCLRTRDVRETPEREWLLDHLKHLFTDEPAEMGPRDDGARCMPPNTVETLVCACCVLLGVFGGAVDNCVAGLPRQELRQRQDPQGRRAEPAH